jgi:acetyl esterase
MALPSLHAEMKVLQAAQKTAYLGSTVDEQREAWSAYARMLARPCPPELTVTDAIAPTPARNVPVRIYRHRSARRPAACAVYMHGGGFMKGDLDSSDSIAWGFAHEAGATVVSVDYRLTPEHVWPAAFDDCFGVVSWLIANASTVNIDPDRIALVGDSAGARLAAGLSIKTRDIGAPRIVAQALIYGHAGVVPDTPSAKDFGEGFGLTTPNMEKYRRLLFPDSRYDADPYAWPVRADNHAGLPPTLVHAAQLDPGRDSARIYAAKLAAAGTDVTYREAPGMMHGFLRARFHGPAAKAEFDFICSFLALHLESKRESWSMWTPARATGAQAQKTELHPDMQVLLGARKGLPQPKTVAEQRDQWSRYASTLSRPHPATLVVRDEVAPTPDRGVPVRIYRPTNPSAALPCILYMHGGGFMLGDLDSSDSIAWGLAEGTGAVVVSIDYRLTPENVWPAAFDDCYGVLSWVVTNDCALGIDPRRLALAGDSAGGRLAAGLSLKARDQGHFTLCAQAMIYASAGATPDSRSAVEFAEGYGLTTEKYKKFYKALFPDSTYDSDSYAWPIRAKDVGGLPPTLIHPAEIDPIRDDGRAYAAKLMQAGNQVVYREARGMIHGFMRARFFGSAAKAEFDFVCAFLRHHLSVPSAS